MRLGKHSAQHDPRDLQFEHYVEASALPAHPAVDIDNLNLIGDWGMLGNDDYGDCVFAGADHEVMLWNALGGSRVSFSAENALSDYSAVTGFKPSDPNSDQGTEVHTALEYRRKTGTVDNGGQRHKLGAYISLEVGNTTHVREAMHLLDAVAIGFEFPTSAWAQLKAGRPWSVVPGSQIDGGHYVPVIGYTPRRLFVVTWGQIQAMTWGFFERYTDEAYALLSLEFLRAGRSPEGFDLGQLQNDLSLL